MLARERTGLQSVTSDQFWCFVRESRGGESRTLVKRLKVNCSTVELHPQILKCLWEDSNLHRSV